MLHLHPHFYTHFLHPEVAAGASHIFCFFFRNEARLKEEKSRKKKQEGIAGAQEDRRRECRIYELDGWIYARIYSLDDRIYARDGCVGGFLVIESVEDGEENKREGGGEPDLLVGRAGRLCGQVSSR
jgi:hypothetical protein